MDIPDQFAARIVIGAQVSTAGGVPKAVERAVVMGCDAVQVFVDPNRRFPRGPLPLEQLHEVRHALEAAGMPAYVHVPYLANVATADAILRERSIDMVARALQASAVAGISGVVVHPGSHLGRGFAAVREHVVLALGEAAQRASTDVLLMLENTAGAGGQLGASVAELRSLLDGLDSAGARAGICFDTQHAHAAGWDLSTEAGVERCAADLRREGLAARIGLVHANDSRTAAGSRRDMHANPGEGTIGASGLAALARLPELARVPWILEVPGHEKGGPRREDVERLREIVSA